MILFHPRAWQDILYFQATHRCNVWDQNLVHVLCLSWHCFIYCCVIGGIILSMGSASERRWHYVMPSPFDWDHTQKNNPWIGNVTCNTGLQEIATKQYPTIDNLTKDRRLFEMWCYGICYHIQQIKTFMEITFMWWILWTYKTLYKFLQSKYTSNATYVSNNSH